MSFDYFKTLVETKIKKSVLKRLAMTKIAHQNFVSYDIKYLPNRFDCLNNSKFPPTVNKSVTPFISL